MGVGGQSSPAQWGKGPEAYTKDNSTGPCTYGWKGMV